MTYYRSIEESPEYGDAVEAGKKFMADLKRVLQMLESGGTTEKERNEYFKLEKSLFPTLDTVAFKLMTPKNLEGEAFYNPQDQQALVDMLNEFLHRPEIYDPEVDEQKLQEKLTHFSIYFGPLPLD